MAQSSPRVQALPLMYLPSPSYYSSPDSVPPSPTQRRSTAARLLVALGLGLGCLAWAFFGRAARAPAALAVARPVRLSRVVRGRVPALRSAMPDVPLADSSLGYMTSSEAADIINYYGTDMNWRRWDEQREDDLRPAPPVAAKPKPKPDPEPGLLAKFSVVGGGVFALALIALTALRTLTSSDETAAAPEAVSSPAEPQGAVPDFRFENLVGMDEVKEQLEEVVQFLRSPQDQQYGALLTGPNLSDNVDAARAIAGESGMRLFRVSGSGRGTELAATFEEAVKAAPCVMLVEDVAGFDMQTIAAFLTATDRLEAEGTPMALLAVAERSESLNASLTRFFGLRVNVLGPRTKSALEAQLSKAMGEEPAPTEEEGTFWSKVDEAVWDFAIGSKEKKWNPDRRDDKTRVTPQNSTLSWGTIRPVTEDYAIETLEEMAEGLRAQAEAQMEIIKQRKALGLEEDGADEREKLNERVYMEATIADVPTGVDRVLTGRQLAELCFAKYGCYYDMALIQFKPLGDTMARQIAFNIYGATLGSINFAYSERQYLEKLELVAQILNRLDHAWYVRAFFKLPIKPRRGLPSTPRSDTAVTLRLNTSPTWQYVKTETVREYFP